VYVVVTAFASKIEEVDITSSIVELSDVAFWINVMDKMKNSTRSTECKWRQCSKLIAAFCQKSLESLDLEAFRELTSEDRLPSVSNEAALPLMATEKQLVENGNHSSSSFCSSLRDRCVQALSGTWKKLAGKETPFMESLKKQHPEFLAELLSTCLAKASSEVPSVLSSERSMSPESNRSPSISRWEIRRREREERERRRRRAAGLPDRNWAVAERSQIADDYFF
jgi:hypothetical protein